MIYDLEDEGYFKICSVKELNENSGKYFFVNETDIALFKVDGEIFALNNVCPHQHAALIYSGFVENNFVSCPAHGWQFNLQTGKQPDGNRGLDIYPVKVKNDFVFVKVYKKNFNW